MRYSKNRIIVTSIISFICIIAILVLIYNGIEDSKKLTKNNINSKLKANISDNLNNRQDNKNTTEDYEPHIKVIIE